MQQYDLESIVATSAVNVRYFSDYFCWTDSPFKEYMVCAGNSNYPIPIYSVFSKESGETGLIVSPSTAADAMETKNIKIYTYGNPSHDLAGFKPGNNAEQRELFEILRNSSDKPSSTDILIDYLVRAKLDTVRIGLEMEGLNPVVRDRIIGSLPQAEILDCSSLLRICRTVKSAEEIAILKRAFQIAETAAMESLKQAHSGKSMQEVIDSYRILVAQGGADFEHFAYGLKGTGIVTQRNYILEKGDYLFIDYGCLDQGYYSDSGLTLAVGNPASETKKIYNAFLKCQQRAVESMRPGVKSSVIADLMQTVLMEEGIMGCLPHGHGLGLEIREFPLIYPATALRITDGCVDMSSDIFLEEDMVPILEVSLFQFGRGSVHLEQCFHVTRTGCNPLINLDREEMFVVD
jgi:Xaa-Pro aminopeptidase